jgi:hypothetical protein
VSGRHVQDPEEPAREAEATRTAVLIKGLGWRLLQRPEILEHPKVLAALRTFEEQVGEQLAYANKNPGRHRSTTSTAVGQDISEVPGDDLKPNPLTATTAEAFIEVLGQYRAWSGDPPYRVMAERAGQAVVYSTMYNAMTGNALPKLHVVRAIIIGCGGGEDDMRLFDSAWRRINMGQARGRPWMSRSSDDSDG